MFRFIFTLFVSVVVAYIFLASLSGCSSRRSTSEITTEVGFRFTHGDAAHSSRIAMERIEFSTTSQRRGNQAGGEK